MVLAAYYDTGFKVVLLLHILSVLVAFGPLFFLPVLGRSSHDEASGNAMLLYLQRFATPAVVLAGFFGLIMIGMSKTGGLEIFSFKQAWVSAALAIWIVEVALFIFAILPTQRKAAGGDTDAAKRLPMFTGIIHLTLLVMLVLMIWRPGAHVT
jgi:uncharacterized membrane protein